MSSCRTAQHRWTGRCRWSSVFRMQSAGDGQRCVRVQHMWCSIASCQDRDTQLWRASFQMQLYLRHSRCRESYQLISVLTPSKLTASVPVRTLRQSVSTRTCSNRPSRVRSKRAIRRNNPMLTRHPADINVSPGDADSVLALRGGGLCSRRATRFSYPRPDQFRRYIGWHGS